MKKLMRKPRRFKGLTVGLDVHKKFIEYAALNRKGDQVSGGKVSGQVITKAGSRLARWALTRAALACLRRRRGPGLQVKYWMLARMKHKPRKKVLVAAARKLAEALWRLFKYGEVFDLERAFPLPRQGGRQAAQGGLRGCVLEAWAAQKGGLAGARSLKRSGQTEAGSAGEQPAEG